MTLKKIVIVGAGQMGKAVSQLLNPNQTELLGFADNDSGKWTNFEEIGASEPSKIPERLEPTKPKEPPVFSVDRAIELSPDEMIISVLGGDRAEELAGQLKDGGYAGEIAYLKEIYNDFDIRSRCIRLAAERIRDWKIAGDLAELGVYRGDTAWQLNELMPDRKLYLFDTFEGFDDRDVKEEEVKGVSRAKAGDFSDTAAEQVLRRMAAPEQAVVRKGFFPETAEGLEHLKFALVSLDPDLYAPTLAGLRYFYPRMNSGGMIVVHDYNNLQFRGVKQAIAEYEAELTEQGSRPMKLVPLADLHGTCVIVK